MVLDEIRKDAKNSYPTTNIKQNFNTLDIQRKCDMQIPTNHISSPLNILILSKLSLVESRLYINLHANKETSREINKFQVN